LRASSTPRGSIAGGGTRTVCPVVDLRLPCGIRRGGGRGVSAPRRDAGRPSIHSGDRSLAGRVGRGERIAATTAGFWERASRVPSPWCSTLARRRRSARRRGRRTRARPARRGARRGQRAVRGSRTCRSKKERASRVTTDLERADQGEAIEHPHVDAEDAANATGGLLHCAHRVNIARRRAGM
jgi:hypothetical protein